MAELKPKEVIIKIDFAASKGLEIVANVEEVSELVRCKDCEHYNPNSMEWPCDCVGGLADPVEDDYCSYGERRIEND